MTSLKLKLLMTSILLILIIILVFTLQINSIWNQPLTLKEPSFLTVNKGENLNRLCHRIKENGWLESCFAVKVLSKVKPEIAKIKSGTYKISAGVPLNEFVNTLMKGEEHQFAFTIIEGENMYQVIDKISTIPTIHNDLKPLIGLPEQFNISFPSLEGLLAPNTYFYTDGTNASQIINRALKQQKALLDDAWESRQQALPIQSPYELLILASIIEKESSIADEHNKIASVFYNRLNRRMRLQTDPTIIYGVWEEYDGDIKRIHLKTKTPYNTYRIDGLPPTPISNPSYKALMAAANPEQTEYLYFVASGDGGHVFNKTLKAHNKSLRTYLQKQKERSQ